MFDTLASNVRAAVSRIDPEAAVPAAIAAALVALPAGLQAQNAAPGPTAGNVSVDARGGIAIPVDNLDDMLKTGASFGGGIAVFLTDRVALRGDVEYRLFTGDRDRFGTLFADMTSLAATGGVEIHFVSPETRWTGAFSLGAGISTLDTENVTDTGDDPPAVTDPSLSGVAFRSGAKLGYRPSETITVYLEPAVYLSLFDRADTQGFAAASPQVEPFDTSWVIPVQAGVRFALQ